jgi:hypothetical protein
MKLLCVRVGAVVLSLAASIQVGGPSVAFAAAADLAPQASGVCPDGSITCVDGVIDKLQDKLTPLLATCDHKAVFNLFYLRTVQAYEPTALTPGYYQNPALQNRLAAGLGHHYFQERSAWEAGDFDSVPDAAKIAFFAADNKKVTAIGDVFLAVNAEILFNEVDTLDQIGLTNPDGTTAKVDYDKDDQWLAAVGGPTFLEEARRLDPTILQPVVINSPDVGALDFQLVVNWREQAWQFAARLKLAEQSKDAALRSIIRAEINAQAVTNALAIMSATQATEQQVADRDAYCMAHRNDP